MLTTPLHSHPWTRVSWISGSDIDDLDEEEVQEVERVTLGRASSVNNNGVNTASAAVGIPSSNSEEEDAKTQRVTNISNSVTLKPFSFGTNEDSDTENSSDLIPFAVNDDINRSCGDEVNTATTNVVNTTPPCFAKPMLTIGKDMLLAQKGDLITPAVTDAVSEEDISVAAVDKKPSSWKAFWQGSNKEEDEPTQEEDVKTTEERTWDENVDVVEEDEEVYAEAGNWAVTARAQGLKAARAAEEMAKGCYLWVVGALLGLWVTVVSFGIRLNSKIQIGFTAAKRLTQDWADKTVELWESNVIPAVGPAAGHVACGLALGAVAVACLFPAKRTPSPTSDLREFVRFERANNFVDLAAIDDLNTETFRTYARSTCVEAATFEQARNALDVGLFGVPDGVRNTVVQMAVLEGVTQKNSIQDSNSDFVNSGKANAFMAFWSTVHDPSLEEEAYKSCVMVTGVSLTVAESIAEWTTKREKYQVGTEPCHCGKLH